jgi:hypothetical protein
MSPLSSGSKKESSKMPAELATCFMLHADFLLGLVLNTDDRGDMFLQNVG